jgi:molybdopterin-guanine dinucleotide biosynthesis protein A
MGQDKALLERDGVALARRVAMALYEAGASCVTAVGGDETGLQAAGLLTTEDHFPGEGPLGGIVTAMREAAPNAIVLVAPCDLVTPDAALFEALADAATGDRVVAPVADGRRHPIPSAWPAATRPTVEAAFLAGERSPARLLDGMAVLEVPITGDLRDADEPSDLLEPPG